MCGTFELEGSDYLRSRWGLFKFLKRTAITTPLVVLLRDMFVLLDVYQRAEHMCLRNTGNALSNVDDDGAFREQISKMSIDVLCEDDSTIYHDCLASHVITILACQETYS